MKKNEKEKGSAQQSSSKEDTIIDLVRVRDVA